VSDVIRQVTMRGRVQGVGFRAFVEWQAMQLDLEGWVRNRRDGSVEAVFCGPPEAVAAMIALCRQGPSVSHVTALADEAASADQLALRRAGERFSSLPTV
jgi:acylphosphatase